MNGLKIYGSYGFTHGEYLDTLNTGWIHVSVPDVTIAREVYRRWHTMKNNLTRQEVKDYIRQLIQEHRENKDLYRAVMNGTF